jgi:hypothetical protein
MAMTSPARAEVNLEFDTLRFRHSLFGNDPKNLAYLESGIGVEAYERHRE